MTQTRRRRHGRGGAAIAAGGYGCVFSPALTCAGSPSPSARARAASVSKLMLKRDAEDEIQEISAVYPILSSIPHSSHYFLGIGADAPVRACEPKPLTGVDKLGFSKCSVLKRDGITSSNINSKLAKVRIINSPYGGLELEQAWTRVSTMGLGLYTPGFKAVNNACRRLLKHGILPMNKKGLLHGDIKAPNVLVDVNSSEDTLDRAGLVGRLLGEINPTLARRSPPYVEARLIDWGLSMRVPPNGTVPSDLTRGRSLMYNAPMSAILFNSALQGHIRHYYKDIGLNSPMSPLGRQGLMWNLALRVYALYKTIVGSRGHDAYLTELVANVYAPLLVGPEARDVAANVEHGRLATFQTTIVEYIAEVFANYLDANGNFMARRYFDSVFKKNMDVYGLVMCYAPVIDSRQYDDLFEWKRPLSNGVVRLLAEYCFSPKYAATAIPVDKLLDDLGKLNDETEDHSPVVRGTSSSPPASPTPPGSAARQAQPSGAAQAYRRGNARRCRAGFKYRASDGMCVPKTRRPSGTRRRSRCPNGTRRGRDGQCHPK